jgi:CheY-like chemotaxis protein
MKKILIVDDEEVIRMLYGEELEEEGYKVVTAGFCLLFL